MTPEMPVQQRAQGGYTPAVDTDPHNGGPCDCDWSIPTTAALLRHRVFKMPDQSRYGRRSASAPRPAPAVEHGCRECGKTKAACKRLEATSGHTYTPAGA